MSFKHKKERSCITLGMSSTSSGFTYKPLIVSINKTQQFYFRSITVFVFIFGLPTLLNHKERIRELGLSEIHGARKGPGSLHETSHKYTYFQKIVLLFQRITITPENYNHKIVLYISENYNQQQPLKAKTTRKRKGKPEKKKRGEERYNIRNRT